ncbi:WD repeat-containing protein on Y chromosome-like isoform X3 [Oopsacas minuta]|uniref:WD repeat-containing protein on Y chromosome-like isoform X3 n=1 Tax=Oopsacas minuta TaxID=111878 RepID=A0AAV7K9J6_9METZ|nr:WD repeat-containing protein on Y chromosome-like isoform X3 [Oopsacas minuta]
MSEEDSPDLNIPGEDDAIRRVDNSVAGDNESDFESEYSLGHQEEIGKRVEDMFTLRLLDELGSNFSESTPSPRVDDGERLFGGHMSLLQFINTISSLLQTQEFSSQLRILFQKLDTRGTGFLSWSKLCSYLLTYLREKTQAERRERHVLQDKPKFSRSPYSRSVTVLLVYLESIKKYLLVSKDGVISLWTRDLTPISSYKLQSLLPGPIKLKGAPSYKPKAKVWVTSAVFFPELNKLILSTTSSDIYFISFLPPDSFLAQYQLTELPSPAFSLASHEQSSLLMLLCGCADGSLLALRFLSPEQGLFSQEHTSKRDECVKVSGRNLHRYQQFVVAATYPIHNQWVRRIEYLPSFQSAITCSHCTKVSLAITDLQRIKQPYLFSLPKGISCFCYCNQLTLLLTGSVDRIVRVWCPYVPFKPTALLMGHEAFITDVMVYYPKGVFLSLDTGGMVRIWDAIWNNCIQFVQLVFPLPSQSWEFGPRSFFTGEVSSSLHSTCANHLASFGLAPGTGESEFQGIRGCSLKAPPCAALYASTFSLVIVGSEDSTIFTYDIYTGRRLYVIPSAHAREEITAMCIDQSGRRVITASRIGQAKGWDVNTGELMQTFVAVSPTETTALLPLAKKNLLFSAGWSKEIIAYKDRPEKVSLLLIILII